MSSRVEVPCNVKTSFWVVHLQEATPVGEQKHLMLALLPSTGSDIGFTFQSLVAGICAGRPMIVIV